MRNTVYQSGFGLLALGLAAIAVAATALAAAPQVNLRGLDHGMVGPRTKIMVLGTIHLNNLPKDFKHAALNGVLDRLTAFQPDIITIEALPGEECDFAARFVEKYGADYCASTEAAKAATGLDVVAALKQVEKTLKDWPAQAQPAQRRQLAAWFLAANNRASAYVQWLQLPPEERHSGDGLDAALVEVLQGLATRNDESFALAARLAARLGLQRVHQIDNHTGDLINVPDLKAFGRELEAAWRAGPPSLDAWQQKQDALAGAADLLPLYRYINAPAQLRLLAAANVVPAMRSKSASGYGPIWVGGWEVRNLRMVANIRETFRERPGVRVLSVVGVSHKPWFDHWLGSLQGVDIVDTVKALK